ncbi:hypothetical protein [Arthrobacter sp. NPDC056493]|uniref:hypothetical protein n=1 Tax=Arthrobacter sp. NPDC056493 TaxID=3345839 RepID=UPI00366EF0EB
MNGDPAVAPVISLFAPALGSPLARGVLMHGQAGPSAVFRPWPKSITGKEFGVYVPAYKGTPAQWLAPAKVQIIEGVDTQGGTLGVVSFTATSVPTRTPGVASKAKFDEALAQPNASRWDAVRASIGDNLERLAKLDGSLPNRKLIPKTVAMPEWSPPVNVAGITPGDFVCQHILHWD